MSRKRRYMKVALVVVAIAVALAIGIGVAQRRGDLRRSHPGVISNQVEGEAAAVFATFSESLDRGGLTLYEGLPHSWEREAYAREVAREDLIWHHGFPFYDAPVELDGEAAAAVLALLTEGDRMHVTPVGVAKACGGFHPDYSLLLRAGERRYDCQLCFGCSDLAIMEVGVRGGVVMSLDPTLARELRVLLDGYHQRRPITTDFHPYTAEEMAADLEADRESQAEKPKQAE